MDDLTNILFSYFLFWELKSEYTVMIVWRRLARLIRSQVHDKEKQSKLFFQRSQKRLQSLELNILCQAVYTVYGIST